MTRLILAVCLGSMGVSAVPADTIWIPMEQAVSRIGPLATGASVGIVEEGALGDFLVPLVCVSPDKLDGGYAEFQIQVPRTATYYVWARLRYPTGTCQSFALTPPIATPRPPVAPDTKPRPLVAPGETPRPASGATNGRGFVSDPSSVLPLGESGRNVADWHWDNGGGGCDGLPGGKPLKVDLKQGLCSFRVYPRQSSATVFRPQLWRMARPEFNPRLNLLCFTTDSRYVPADADAGRALNLQPARVDVDALRVRAESLPAVSDADRRVSQKREVPDWLRCPRWYTKDSWRFELGLRKPGDIAGMIRQAAANEASAIRLSVYWGGEVYYPSRIAPKAPGLGDLDYLKEATEEGRRLGLRVVMYVNPNAVYEGHPLYDEAAVRGPDGKPATTLAYGIPKTRYTCVENPAFRRFFLEVLREAFTRYDLAGLYVDGLTPQPCLCSHCRAKYQRLWGEPMPVEKFARQRPWCVLWEMTNGYDPLGEPSDPQWQRYTQFRARSLDEITAEVRRVVRQARPGAATLFHSWPKPGNLECYDGSLTEVYLHQPWRHKLWKQFELAGYANSFPVPMFFNIYLHDFGTEAEARLKAAQGLAAGCYPNFWNLAAMRPLFRFMRENAEYLDFARTRPVPFLLFPRAIRVDAAMQQAATADAGVRFRPDRYLSPYVGFAGAMIRAGLPIESVGQHQFQTKLAGRRVLALAGEACLSDAQVEAVRQFVLAGGGLVATGETSLCDEHGRRRKDFALADVLGAHFQTVQAGAPRQLEAEGDHPLARALGKAGKTPVEEPLVAVRCENQEVVATLATSDGGPRWPAAIARQYGRGRVVYFPARLDAVLCGRLEPAITDLLTGAVRWAARDQTPVEIHATSPVAVSLFEQANRWIVHLVNLQGDSLYANDAIRPAGPMEVRLRLPRDDAPKSVRCLWKKRDLPFDRTAGALRFRLPELDLYEVIAVDWLP